MDQRPIPYFTDSAHGAAGMVFPSGCFLSAGFYTMFSLCALFAFSVTDFISWPDGRGSTFHKVMLDVFWGVLPFMGLVKEGPLKLNDYSTVPNLYKVSYTKRLLWFKEEPQRHCTSCSLSSQCRLPCDCVSVHCKK